MPDIDSALASVAAERARDPLSPVTFVVPSHAAGLQLRRRLAALRPFAAVRFETLPRLAELIAAGPLAAHGRAPLARPIGDYVAQVVARDSRGGLERIAGLAGYARVLRQLFRRLRRGGIRSSADVKIGPFGSHLDEVLRLYDGFRERTAAFYDDEDELEAAAGEIRAGQAAVLSDLGLIYVVPPGPLTTAGVAVLDALRNTAAACVELEEPESSPQTRLILAPDPASEAREVVRDIVAGLEGGLSLHEIAVFHGSDRAYARLLREQFGSAGIPCVPLPGIPLAEKATGRAAVLLASLPKLEYSRTATMDFLHIAPLKYQLPAGEAGLVRPSAAPWDRLSREAGIVRGAENWSRRLKAALFDLDRSLENHESVEDDARSRAIRANQDSIHDLQAVVVELISRLEPLQESQPASSFISSFSGIVADYLDDRAEGYDDVMHEIEQLGTVGAIGGEFSLDTFFEALQANLEARYVRPTRLGDGVIVADYRTAPGLQFKRVMLCGAYEGALPAGPGPDPLVDDRDWARLRESHPFIEDVQLRLQRSEEAVVRAVASGDGGTLVWSSPLSESGGTRDYYPSVHMVAAARVLDPAVATASDLRNAGAQVWLNRGTSPMSLMLHNSLVDRVEAALREAMSLRRRGDDQRRHRKWPSVEMLRERRSDGFTKWDGNISELAGAQLLELQRAFSPTSLENYASCGFKYFCKSVLRLNVVEEPEERQIMDPATRGSIVHDILERFFREQMDRNRPQPYEAWSESDLERLLQIVDEALEDAGARGLTGLDVYMEHEARTIRADLTRFLEDDTAFRRLTGAVPWALEQNIPETSVAGVTMRGRVDRIDRSTDGREAWVMDYKTGGLWDTRNIQKGMLLDGGKKLQLPTYLLAADAENVHALYWFISQRGGFEKVSYDPTPEWTDRYHKTLDAIVNAIRGGAFPAVPGEEDEYYGGFTNCRYCDFDRICPQRRDQAFASKQGDAGVRTWSAIAAIADGVGEQP